MDDESSWRKPFHGIMNGVDLLEKELTKRGSTFFGGKTSIIVLIKLNMTKKLIRE